MKFTTAFTLLTAVVGSVSATMDMTIKGNTKGAAKLLKEARRLQNQGGQYYGNNMYYNNGNRNGGNYGQGNYQYNNEAQDQEVDEEQEMAVLGNYALKMLTCHSGEYFKGGDNGEEFDYNTVVFRLCPIDNCNPNGSYGCQQGYGDYAIGMSQYLELVMENQKQQQEQAQQANQNGGGNYYNYNNGGQQAQQANYNPYYFTDMYGQEFNVEEYSECRQYEMGGEDNANQGNGYYNYGNNQYNMNQYQDAQFFIGPTCSDDGTSIKLGFFSDEDCMYQSNVAFEQVSNGWTMPYSSGGLGSSGECMSCAPYYNGNGEYEYPEFCMQMYESSGYKCEANMQYSVSYYGANNYGCDYLKEKVSSVYGTGQSAKKVMDNIEEDFKQGKVSGMGIALIAIAALLVLTGLAFCGCRSRSTAAASTDSDYVAAPEDGAKGEVA